MVSHILHYYINVDVVICLCFFKITVFSSCSTNLEQFDLCSQTKSFVFVVEVLVVVHCIVMLHVAAIVHACCFLLFASGKHKASQQNQGKNLFHCTVFGF